MKKNERGSVTIFVLCSCLLILLILISGFMRNQSKISSQREQQKLIEQQYNDDDRIDEIYEDTVENMQLDGGDNEN